MPLHGVEGHASGRRREEGSWRMRECERSQCLLPLPSSTVTFLIPNKACLQRPCLFSRTPRWHTRMCVSCVEDVGKGRGWWCLEVPRPPSLPRPKKDRAYLSGGWTSRRKGAGRHDAMSSPSSYRTGGQWSPTPTPTPTHSSSANHHAA